MIRVITAKESVYENYEVLTITKYGQKNFPKALNIKKLVVQEEATELREDEISWPLENLEEIILPRSLKVMKLRFGGSFRFPQEKLARVNSTVNGEFNIPSRVTLCSNCFSDCPLLQKITLDTSVIPKQAFFMSENLTDCNLGNNVRELQDQAFRRCTSLVTLKLPDSLEAIGDEVFCECTKLEEMYIPDNVTKMGYAIFQDCPNLKQVSLPGDDWEEGEFRDMFRDCSSLERVYVRSNRDKGSVSRFRIGKKVIPVIYNNSKDSKVSSKGASVRVKEYPEFVKNKISLQAFYSWNTTEGLLSLSDHDELVSTIEDCVQYNVCESNDSRPCRLEYDIKLDKWDKKRWTGKHKNEIHLLFYLIEWSEQGLDCVLEQLDAVLASFKAAQWVKEGIGIYLTLRSSDRKQVKRYIYEPSILGFEESN